MGEARGRSGDLERFHRLTTHFQRYGQEYNIDWLLMVAQGYQESRLNQNAKSAVGAIGVMQIMPATGKELQVGSIHVEQNNIRGGISMYGRRSTATTPTNP